MLERNESSNKPRRQALHASSAFTALLRDKELSATEKSTTRLRWPADCLYAANIIYSVTRYKFQAINKSDSPRLRVCRRNAAHPIRSLSTCDRIHVAPLIPI